MHETWVKNISPKPLHVDCYMEIGKGLVLPATVRLEPGEGAWLRTFLQWLLGTGHTVVRVVSWRPSRGQFGVEWPTMHVRSPGGRQSTVSLVWDRARIMGLWKGVR